jgi:hypothetical protein
MNSSRIATISLSALGGASAALILDPRAGARRRALLRDKARHYLRIAALRLQRLGRRLPGPARGAIHAATTNAPWREPPLPPDEEEYIKHRVESTLGRQRDLPLSALSFDAADGVVRVRGTVPDSDTADRVVQRVMSVNGVRAVLTYMRTPDSRPIQRAEGDETLISRPRAELQTGYIREEIMRRWPAMTDDDILASQGHLERLTSLIAMKSGRPESEIRPALDMILMQPAMHSVTELTPRAALSSQAAH